MIEKAAYEDLEEILKLQILANLSEAEIYNDYTLPPLIQTLAGIRQDYENKVFLKATKDGKIVGSIRAYENGGTCYIGRLMVHPEYQNKGIGKALMKSMEEHFSGCKKFSLFTGNKSLKNLYLYYSLGYIAVKEEIVNNNLTLVYLEKAINEPEH